MNKADKCSVVSTKYTQAAVSSAQQQIVFYITRALVMQIKRNRRHIYKEVGVS